MDGGTLWLVFGAEGPALTEPEGSGEGWALPIEVRLHRAAAGMLGVGSVALLLSVITGARVGMEDAPTMSGPATAWFQVSVWLIAAGLATVGGQQLRWDPEARHGAYDV